MPEEGSNSRRNRCSYACLFFNKEFAAYCFDVLCLLAVLISYCWRKLRKSLGRFLRPISSTFGPKCSSELSRDSPRLFFALLLGFHKVNAFWLSSPAADACPFCYFPWISGFNIFFACVTRVIDSAIYLISILMIWFCKYSRSLLILCSRMRSESGSWCAMTLCFNIDISFAISVLVYSCSFIKFFSSWFRLHSKGSRSRLSVSWASSASDSWESSRYYWF